MSARRRRRAVALALPVAVVLALATPLSSAWAEGEPEPDAAASATVPTAPVATAASEATTDPAEATLKLGRGGLSIRSADGAFGFRLRADLQIDGRFFVEDAALPIADGWLVRRARPILEATLFRFVDLRLMPDFGGGQSEIYDAFLEARLAPSARLRIGKFRPPLGLERLQSARDLVFLERAAPTLLVPNRDVGVQLGGALAGGRIEYQIGAFNGVVDGGRADFAEGDGEELAARLVWRPFAGSPGAPDFGIGLAGSRGDAQGTMASPRLPTYKTLGAQTFFRYRSDGTEGGTTVADGRRVRAVPQAFLYAGPLGVMAEYARSAQRVRRSEATAELVHAAWQLQLSWVLTGERNGYKGVEPARPLELSGDSGLGGRGAWIVALRATGIEFDGAAFPRFADPDRAAQGATSWGACLSWNLAPGVRWLIDLDLTRFDGGTSGGSDRPDEKEISTRFQVAF